MIYGVGVDITEISRVKKIRLKGDSFAQRVLSRREFLIYHKLEDKRKNEFLAGRFSAKEAYSKALGTGIGHEVSFQDLEIIDNQRGKPELLKHPRLGELNAFVSISHTDDLVMTEVILEKKD